MLAALFAAATLTAPAPIVIADDSKPLRTVVYKVTQEWRSSAGSESYEGHNGGHGGNLDAGTVTVNIMAVGNNGLGIQVIELMNSKGSPYQFTGVVTPDGSVRFPAVSIEDVTRELLQYFATQFVPNETLDVGAKWQVNIQRSAFNVATQYTVKNVNGDVVTLDESQTAKVNTLSGSGSMTGTIDYKPSLLVPLRGDLHKTVTTSSAEGYTSDVLNMHFERVSDSRDK